jgi:hypothetical protein
MHKHLFLQILYFQNPGHVEMNPKSKREKISQEKMVIENFPRKFSDVRKYPLVSVMLLVEQKNCIAMLASSRTQKN